MSKNYSFSIYLKSDGSNTTVYPKYDSLEKEYYVDKLYAKRYKINCTFEFSGSTDYDFIMSKDFGTKFYLRIFDLNLLKNYAEGYFYLSDCEVDQDLKIIKTQITIEDYYDKIEEIQDTEVDLCKINIKKVPIYYNIPPLIQIYVLGDSKLTNFQNGISWEQECTQYFDDTINNSEWKNRIQFDAFLYQYGTHEISQLYNLYGYYIEGFMAMWLSNDERFFITTVLTNGRYSRTLIKEQFTDDRQCVTVWQSEEFIWNEETYDILDLTFTNLAHGYTMKFSEDKSVYIRLLCKDSFDDFQTVDNNFEVCENKIYNKIVIIEYPNVFYEHKFDIVASLSMRVEETEYPLSQQNRYFTKYISDNYYEYIPIGIGTWSYFSLWIRSNPYIQTYCAAMSHEEITQGYHIKDTMLAFFKHFNLNLTYYSFFFQNATNPITKHTRQYPIITQITNIKTIDGVLAAVNKTSLKEIIDFICNRFNLSWHINGNQFRFEHIYYYFNNYSYTLNENYIDVTNKICSRNELSWSSKQNQWKYDVSQKYKKHILKNDYESNYFGYSEIKTEYPEETLVKTTDFNRIACDISYIHSGILDIKDGNFFGLFDYVNSKYTLQFETQIYKGNTVLIQNSTCSLPYCAVKFYGYNDYGVNVLINGISQAVRGFFRGRIQEIEYSIGNESDPDYYKLIKTELGIAFCKKIVVNCESKIVKMTLSHGIN